MAVSTALPRRFARIERLPPYVFSITAELKLAARRRGEDIIDLSMGNPDGATPPHIVAKLVEGGYDSAVVFRLIGVNEKHWDKISYAGTYYSSFGTYWGAYGVPVYSNMYSTREQIVQVEATLYSLAGQKLVWAAQTELVNPSSPIDVIERVTGDTYRGLTKEKLIR